MKIKKILLLCLLPLMAEVLLACCDCDDVLTYKYSYDKMSIINLDNTGKDAIETSAAEVAKDAYGIRLKITLLEAAALPDNNHSLFLSPAKAICACPPAYYSNEYFLSFKIITVNDFDETHKAGSDVTGYFKTFTGESYQKIYLEEYVNESYFDEKKNIKLDMLLMNKPASSAQQFRVEAKLSDGREFNEITAKINLI